MNPLNRRYSRQVRCALPSVSVMQQQRQQQQQQHQQQQQQQQQQQATPLQHPVSYGFQWLDYRSD